ncbi:MAG: FAD-dependent oxidoreductase [bacterium]|nr:FAD-dependent oxidoreductase [bacterium]
MKSEQSTDILIIGGGVIGLFCAYYLSETNSRITILDKGPANEASSHGNCGLITPSHVLPLNSWPLVFTALKSMRKGDAPFHMKPQISKQFLNWGMQFLRNCNHNRVINNARSIQELLTPSRAYYDELFEKEEIECNWRQNGIYFLFKNKNEFDHFSKENELTSRFGQNAIRIPKQELLEKEPALREDIAGAWIYSDDAWLRPNELVSGLKKILVGRGVEFLESAEVVGFEKYKDRLINARTSKGVEIKSNQFVLAAGAWSPLLASKMGLNLPIIPGKGYSITMGNQQNAPTRPIIMMERMVVATPWSNGYRLGSTMELAGYDSSLNLNRLNALRRGASEYLKTSSQGNPEEVWTGWRPLTPDSVPIIGPSKKISNLTYATGHGMLGMSMGPATGKIVSDILK